MNITLPADLEQQMDRELASGRFQSSEQLIEQALRYYLEDHRRSQRRIAALDRIGTAVDEAGLYDRVLIPQEE